MREGKKFKKLLIGVAAAAMTMLCTLPVSAATKSFKPITVKAGRCLHLLNTNIQSNAITNYSYRIQPQSSGTRYDIVYAYGGEAEALKRYNKSLRKRFSATAWNKSSLVAAMIRTSIRLS